MKLEYLSQVVLNKYKLKSNMFYIIIMISETPANFRYWKGIYKDYKIRRIKASIHTKILINERIYITHGNHEALWAETSFS